MALMGARSATIHGQRQVQNISPAHTTGRLKSSCGNGKERCPFYTMPAGINWGLCITLFTGVFAVIIHITLRFTGYKISFAASLVCDLLVSELLAGEFRDGDIGWNNDSSVKPMIRLLSQDAVAESTKLSIWNKRVH